MGVTRLKRKARRNKQTSAQRNNSIKHLTSKPVIKNIDKEEIKAGFGTPEAAPEKAEAPKKAKASKKEEQPAAEAAGGEPMAILGDPSEDSGAEAAAELEGEEAAVGTEIPLSEAKEIIADQQAEDEKEEEAEK